MRRQDTLNNRELEALPSGNIGIQTLAYVTPGFAATQADVGGTRDTWSAQGNYTFYHGKTGTRANFDGFRNQYFVNDASGVGYITDQRQHPGTAARDERHGRRVGFGQHVDERDPEERQQHVRAAGSTATSRTARMQAANIRDNLNDWALGNPTLLSTAAITSAAKVDKIYRMGGQFGGPIKQDKIWFFAAIARWGSTVQQPSAFYNPLQGKANHPWPPGFVGPTPTLFYPGQPGSPVRQHRLYRPLVRRRLATRHRASTGIARTRAASRRRSTSKNRINFYADLQKSCRCTTGPFTGANSIESERGWDWYPSGVVQGTWTAPLTSRLLLEAGASWQTANWVNFAEEGVTPDDRSILETRDQLPLRRDDAADRAQGAHRPRRAALQRVVRHRHAQHEGRRQQRDRLQRRVAQPQQPDRLPDDVRRPELRLPEWQAESAPVLRAAVSSRRFASAWNSASLRRTRGRSSASR